MCEERNQFTGRPKISLDNRKIFESRLKETVWTQKHNWSVYVDPNVYIFGKMFCQKCLDSKPFFLLSWSHKKKTDRDENIRWCHQENIPQLFSPNDKRLALFLCERRTRLCFSLAWRRGDIEDVARYEKWAGFDDRKAEWKGGAYVVGKAKPCMPPCRGSSSQSPEGAI